jgi:hypothetical protein
MPRVLHKMSAGRAIPIQGARLQSGWCLVYLIWPVLTSRARPTTHSNCRTIETCLPMTTREGFKGTKFVYDQTVCTRLATWPWPRRRASSNEAMIHVVTAVIIENSSVAGPWCLENRSRFFSGNSRLDGKSKSMSRAQVGCRE